MICERLRLGDELHAAFLDERVGLEVPLDRADLLVCTGSAHVCSVQK